MERQELREAALPNYHRTRIGIEARAARAELHRHRGSSSRFQVDRLLNQPQQLRDALANSVKVSPASLMLPSCDGHQRTNERLHHFMFADSIKLW